VQAAAALRTKEYAAAFADPGPVKNIPITDIWFGKLVRGSYMRGDNSVVLFLKYIRAITATRISAICFHAIRMLKFINGHHI